MSDVSVIFIAPRQLAFARITGPYPASSAAAWAVMLDWMATRNHAPIGHVGYGMALDDPRALEANALRYDACIELPATWTDADMALVQVKMFEGGAYLKTRHTGSYGALGPVVARARDELVPRRGLIHDLKRPVLTMYYSYPHETPPEKQIADVCIPVMPDRRATVR